MPKTPKHNRIKPKRKRAMNSAEKAHADRLARMGCMICGSPAEIHHERELGGRRDHTRIVPLCSVHHRTGKDSRHTLGREGFNEAHGVDVVQYALNEWERSNEQE